MSSRVCIILLTALLLLTTVSADKKLVAPGRRLMQTDQPCTKQCGKSRANPTLGPNTYSCLDCGFKSHSDCLAKSTCKTVWARLRSDYNGDPDYNVQLNTYCSILGCYLYGQ